MATVTTQKKAERRLRRKRHIRKQVFGTPERPRLSVYRSVAHMYVQLVDDVAARTLCACSTLDRDLRGTLKGAGNRAAAELVGRKLAERAQAAGITQVVFDRNGFQFHGRVKALAEGARAAGLKF